MKQANDTWEVEPSTEGWGSTIARNIVRPAVKAATTVAGLPGDIAQGAMAIANKGQELVNAGFDAVGLGGMVPDREPAFNQDMPLPTSKVIESGVKSATKDVLPTGFLDPKASWESSLDSIISDAVTLATPIGPLKGLGFRKSLAAAGLGDFAKWGAKEAGLGETGQQAAKIGAMVLASTHGVTKLNEYKEQMYDVAKQEAEKGGSITFKPIEPHLYQARNEIAKGFDQNLVESKGQISKLINNVEAKAVNGKMPVDEAWSFKREINDLVGGKKHLTAPEYQLKKIGNALTDQLHEYGKVNPVFGKAFSVGEDIHKSSAISKFISKAINPGTLSSATLGLLVHGSSLPSAFGQVASLAMIPGAIRSAEILTNSPAARKYYMKILGEAAAKNTKGLTQAVGQLDQVMRREETKNNQWEIEP